MVEFYIVDRIEGEYIVLEDTNGELLDVLKSYVESGVKEGDSLIKTGDYFTIDIEETKKRRDKISTMMKGMWLD